MQDTERAQGSRTPCANPLRAQGGTRFPWAMTGNKEKNKLPYSFIFIFDLNFLKFEPRVRFSFFISALDQEIVALDQDILALDQEIQ